MECKSIPKQNFHDDPHTIALGNMFFHHYVHTHIFWLSPMYTILLPEILTIAPSVDYSTSKKSPQECSISYFLRNIC